jgi:hypothetical protein
LFEVTVISKSPTSDLHAVGVGEFPPSPSAYGLF